MSQSSSTSIPPLRNSTTILDNDFEKANGLNNFFRDQTLLDGAEAEIPMIPDIHVLAPLTHIYTTPEEILSLLKCVPIGKASGPDGIDNRILREISNEISAPLSLLFNHSLTLGLFPDSWKEAHVCAVYKKGDPTHVNNYRPISLLNTVEKVFERIVFKHLFNFLQMNNILTPLQSGFIPNDSTVNQLTFLYNTFCHALDDGKEVKVLFFDISKAFDRVWHRGLIAKLQSIGIIGTLSNWFNSYLQNRSQRVVIPGTKSDWNVFNADVPQGSIIGPLLFLIYINDIVNDIQSNIR